MEVSERFMRCAVRAWNIKETEGERCGEDEADEAASWTVLTGVL